MELPAILNVLPEGYDSIYQRLANFYPSVYDDEGLEEAVGRVVNDLRDYLSEEIAPEDAAWVLDELDPLMVRRALYPEVAERLLSELQRVRREVRPSISEWSFPRDIMEHRFYAACWRQTVPYQDELRMRAATGETVDAYDASLILGVKPGTLRVWAHRGKIQVDHYARRDYQDGNGEQVFAMYRLADVLTIRDAKAAKKK